MMDEIVRCSRRYVLCGEYRADDLEEVPYRGQEGALFRHDYGRLYQERFPSLRLRRGGLPPARRRRLGRHHVLGVRAGCDRGRRLRHGQPAVRAQRASSASARRRELVAEPGGGARRRARRAPRRRRVPATRSRALRERGLAQAVRDAAAAGRPVLGLCLGMQLLATRSTRVRRARGPRPDPRLGRAHRDRARACGSRTSAGTTSRSGAPDADPRRASGPSRPSTTCTPTSSCPTIPAAVTGVTDYGRPVTACVGAGNVFGVQFHPEKSGADGLALLSAFATC